MSEKISIVIPVYKVENYLDQCINSVTGQTYRNLEIILVNDGSPDRCGKMIDEYAERDSRIIALHKKNGGLSDARNFGMTYVTGAYTMFLDSDDWLGKRAVENLLTTLKSNDADVVQSAFYYAHNFYSLFDNRVYDKNGREEVFENDGLMYELVINEKVKNFAWGKLYKTALIKDIPFKKGVLFEDVFWAHHVMQKVKRFVLLHDPLVYYRQRENSIVASYTERNLDILDGLKERHAFLKQHYPHFLPESCRMLFQTSLMHYNLLFLKRTGSERRKEIRSCILEHQKQIREAVSGDSELSNQLKLFLVHPYANIGFLAGRKMLRKLLPEKEVPLEKVR
ncbi:glycosyltransferase family 2 protein [Alteribacter natronophilus]|uniref:glycosyltransferase family 2 protein n=1 Tax=Alteribacter natronophilus TaxID=2583810 RepID=UPI00110ECC12|nr:glycosyltransferase [Alteribacter natronophilus]TMW70545.1 glycosyltransferase [Alteribacter natronophilus]